MRRFRYGPDSVFVMGYGYIKSLIARLSGEWQGEVLLSQGPAVLESP